MLNRRPIFINGLPRGGSNILMNMLISHPDVCLSGGAETHKVFKGTRWDPWRRKVKKRLCYDLPIRLLARQNIFGSHYFQPRKPVPLLVQRYIDYILYYGRFKAMVETHNLYKSENIKYTIEELANCRLLAKGLGGLVYTVEMFRRMYPDAVFFGLIRNGLAICEGFVRRGGKAEKFAQIYKLVVEKMLEYNAQMPNYHIVRYEDMVNNPLEFLHEAYENAQLDIKQLQKVRFQSKAVMGRQGKYNLLKGSDRQVFWYDLADMRKHIKPDINENQIQQLRTRDKSKFISIAGETMEKLGYASVIELQELKGYGI
jgi:hypothetical protein